jgi:hypothetical protein
MGFRFGHPLPTSDASAGYCIRISGRYVAAQLRGVPMPSVTVDDPNKRVASSIAAMELASTDTIRQNRNTNLLLGAIGVGLLIQAAIGAFYERVLNQTMQDITAMAALILGAGSVFVAQILYRSRSE